MHWTIIGGGIQGTTAAIKLRHEGLEKDQLTIIDPYITYVNNLISSPSVLACLS